MPGDRVAGQRALNNREVHTWFFSLNAIPEKIESMRKFLTAEECRRADRYRLPELSRKYTVARGMQRTILGVYSQTRPEEVSFDYTTNGKPVLPGSELHFNLSHSGEYGILAVAKGRKVGIDLEYIRPVSVLSIAKRYFMPDEYGYLASLADAEQLKAFYRLWTCKEAFVKAHGLALSDYLTDVGVSVPLGNGTPRVWLKEGKDRENAWEVYELKPVEGVVAALAVEGENKQALGIR